MKVTDAEQVFRLAAINLSNDLGQLPREMATAIHRHAAGRDAGSGIVNDTWIDLRSDAKDLTDIPEIAPHVEAIKAAARAIDEAITGLHKVFADL